MFLKKYIEAQEIVSDLTVEPDFIRIEVDDDNIDYDSALKCVKELIDLSGSTFNIYYHECHHDENPVQPCKLTFLETYSKRR
jgi:hypothetical protein